MSGCDDLSYFYRDEVYIETTNRCNIRCRFCENPRLSRPRGDMALEVFRKAVNDIADHPHVRTVNLVGMGETFLNPSVWEMIDYAHAKGIACHSCTNGKWHATDEQVDSVTKLRHIHITIDGVTDDVYQISRPNTRVARIFETVQRILQARRRLGTDTPHLQVRMNLFAFNRHQLFDLIRTCRDMGVDSVWVARGAAGSLYQTTLSEEEWDRLPHEYVLTSGFEQSTAADVDRQTGLNAWRYRSGPRSLLDEIGCNGTTIRWDGTITACCFDFNATAVMGHIREDGLKAAWSRARVEAFEQRLLEGHRGRVLSGRTIQCDQCRDFLDFIGRCRWVSDRVAASAVRRPDPVSGAAERLLVDRSTDTERMLLEHLRGRPDDPEALRLLAACATRREENALAGQILRLAIAANVRAAAVLQADLAALVGGRGGPAPPTGLRPNLSATGVST